MERFEQLRGLVDPRQLQGDDWYAQLDAWCSRARAGWPDLTIDEAHLLEVLASKLSNEPKADELAAIDPAELAIAAECASGSTRAQRRFDQTYLKGLEATLRRFGLDADQLGEVAQTVRERLLIPTDDGELRLLAYAGEGKLHSLVRVVATRAAMDVSRRTGKLAARHAELDEPERILEPSLQPDLEAIKSRHRDLIKSAFALAVAGLDPIDRGLLRLHLVEGLSIDRVAALSSVHRSTAARRIARVRERLSQTVRAHLKTKLELAQTGDVAEIYAAVQSQLDLSLSRVFNEARPE